MALGLCLFLFIPDNFLRTMVLELLLRYIHTLTEFETIHGPAVLSKHELYDQNPNSKAAANGASRDTLNLVYTDI